MRSTMIDHNDVLREMTGVLLPSRNDHPSAVIIVNHVIAVRLLGKGRGHGLELPEVLVSF